MKLDHIVLLASNLGGSLTYYELLLPLMGFRKTRDHVFANGDGISVDLRQADDADHEYRRYAPGLNHLGFTAASLDAMQEIEDALREAAYPVPERQSFGDDVALFLRDPDGLRIEIAVYGD